MTCGGVGADELDGVDGADCDDGEDDGEEDGDVVDVGALEQPPSTTATVSAPTIHFAELRIRTTSPNATSPLLARLFLTGAFLAHPRRENFVSCGKFCSQGFDHGQLGLILDPKPRELVLHLGHPAERADDGGDAGDDEQKPDDRGCRKHKPQRGEAVAASCVHLSAEIPPDFDSGDHSEAHIAEPKQWPEEAHQVGDATADHCVPHCADTPVQLCRESGDACGFRGGSSCRGPLSAPAAESEHS